MIGACPMKVLVVLSILCLLHSIIMTVVTRHDGAHRYDDLAADRATAIELAQKAVLNKLKAPRTTHLCEETHVVSNESQAFVVTGYVDAQNSFGAMLRNQYVCKMHKIEERSWMIDQVTFAK